MMKRIQKQYVIARILFTAIAVIGLILTKVPDNQQIIFTANVIWIGFAIVSFFLFGGFMIASFDAGIAAEIAGRIVIAAFIVTILIVVMEYLLSMWLKLEPNMNFICLHCTAGLLLSAPEMLIKRKIDF